MSNDQKKHADWNDCPPGELSRMVRRLEATQRRIRAKKLVWTGLLSMVVLASGVVLGGSLFTAQGGFTYGGITCAQCNGYFTNYYGHLTGTELIEDSELATSMATHLASCKFCQHRFNEAYPGVLQDVARTPSQSRVRNPLPFLATWPAIKPRPY